MSQQFSALMQQTGFGGAKVLEEDEGSGRCKTGQAVLCILRFGAEGAGRRPPEATGFER